MRPYLYMLAGLVAVILLSGCSVVAGLAITGTGMVWDAAHGQGGK